MKTGYAVASAMLAGIGIGALGLHGLQAQTKPPVYMIGMVDVPDPAGYAEDYLPPAQASIKAHGGVYIAGGPGTVIEGSPPGTRFVILRWDAQRYLRVGAIRQNTWQRISLVRSTRSSMLLLLTALNSDCGQEGRSWRQKQAPVLELRDLVACDPIPPPPVRTIDQRFREGRARQWCCRARGVARAGKRGDRQGGAIHRADCSSAHLPAYRWAAMERRS